METNYTLQKYSFDGSNGRYFVVSGGLCQKSWVLLRKTWAK